MRRTSLNKPDINNCSYFLINFSHFLNFCLVRSVFKRENVTPFTYRMGQQTGISSDERSKRQKLQEMPKSLKVRAASHYIAAEYYGKWDSSSGFATSLFSQERFFALSCVFLILVVFSKLSRGKC